MITAAQNKMISPEVARNKKLGYDEEASPAKLMQQWQFGGKDGGDPIMVTAGSREEAIEQYLNIINPKQ